MCHYFLGLGLLPGNVLGTICQIGILKGHMNTPTIPIESPDPVPFGRLLWMVMFHMCVVEGVGIATIVDLLF